MNAWLAVALIAVVVAAVAGSVPLRRAADRQWAEHVRRQRIAALPDFQHAINNMLQLQIVLRDAFTPALRIAAASVAEFGKALDALRPPWWKRVLIRARGWLA